MGLRSGAGLFGGGLKVGNPLEEVFGPDRDAIGGGAIKDRLLMLRRNVLPPRTLRRVHATPAGDSRRTASFLKDSVLRVHAADFALIA